MSLSEKLGGAVAGFGPTSRIAKALAAAGPGRSSEFMRIASLPRRVLDFATMTDVSDLFALPPERRVCSVPNCQITKEGNRLRPVQSAMLLEASGGGLFAPVGIGWGKTLTSLLLPLALNSARAVLLVPPALRRQLLDADVPHLRGHFQIPEICDWGALTVVARPGPKTGEVWVVSYSQLSDFGGADVLSELKPDLIIADEAHHLRAKDSARTRRFLRYMRDNPATRFVPMSGTLTARSVADWAHLSELALRAGSPVPRDYRDLQAWSLVLDPPPPDYHGPPPGEGALSLLCDQGEDVRSGFRRRVQETPGVVATEESSLGDCSLRITLHSAPSPDQATQQTLDLFDKLQAIGGMDVDSPAHAAKVRRRLTMGYYYEWVWASGKPDLEWLEARNAWARWVNRYLTTHNRPGADSRAHVEKAVREGRLAVPAEYVTWARLVDRPEPARRVVWVSDYLTSHIGRMINSVQNNEARIIWTDDPPVGRKLEQAHEIPYFGEGSDAELLQAAPEKTGTLCCSIRAHATGKNLQAWSNNLVLWPSPAEEVWEQLLGRTHRPGQQADEVLCQVLLTTEAARKTWNRALADARVQADLTGQKKRLLLATICESP